MWTDTSLLEPVQVGTAANGQVASRRVSLAGRLASQRAKQPELGRGRWQEVQPSYAAWWREHVDEGGEVRTLLAVNYALAHQMRVPLPDVHDEESFAAVGKRLGVWDPPPPGVPTRSSGGKKRLCILARSVAEELLDNPALWEADPVTPPGGVTDFSSDTPPRCH